MKRICLINPNTSKPMTEACASAVRAFLGKQITLDAVTVQSGPASIEGHYDGALAAVGVLEALAADPHADGYIIACFDDTALEAARCAVSAPVVGIGEAAFHIASLLAHRFAVVTTLSRSVPVIENNLERYGMAARCRGVFATDIPVLELESDSPAAEERIAEQILLARSRKAEAIVLGCAGMVEMKARLEEKCGLPIIDGVTAAAGLVWTMAELGLKTSPVGAYTPPISKRFAGLVKGFGSGPK
jgi:allantoin racemase